MSFTLINAVLGCSGRMRRDLDCLLKTHVLTLKPNNNHVPNVDLVFDQYQNLFASIDVGKTIEDRIKNVAASIGSEIDAETVDEVRKDFLNVFQINIDVLDLILERLEETINEAEAQAQKHDERISIAIMKCKYEHFYVLRKAHDLCDARINAVQSN